MPAKDVVITWTFVARNDTIYTVEHYKEELDGTYPSVASETEGYTWITDTTAVATWKIYEWFTLSWGVEWTVMSGNINGSGDLVLKLYYTRNIHDVIYVYTGKVPSWQVEPGITWYKYGATVNVAIVPAVSWYDFSWNTGTSFVMPDKNVTITWIWIAHKDTKYRVQHMLQDVEWTGYTQTWETQILTWETDELTNAVENSYVWFVLSGSVEQQIIKWNESTVVKIYYDRIEYTVEVKSNDENKWTVQWW
jgi:hypothetical protein